MFKFLKADELPKLSAEDEVKPYSYLYYRNPILPGEETLKELKFGEPMDEKYAVRPENVNVMLDDRYMEKETGYCIFSDGIGYSAAYTWQPDMTPEMFIWFAQWHERDFLRYKIWFPGAHHKASTRWVREDVGFGLYDFFNIQPLDPRIIGFDDEKVKADKSILVIRGQDDWIRPVDGSDRDREKPMGMVVMHMIRLHPEKGLEFRTRFWQSIHFFNGKPVRVIPENERISEEMAYCLAEHGAYEMAAMNAIVPELYAKFKDMP